MRSLEGVEVRGVFGVDDEGVLTPEALDFFMRGRPDQSRALFEQVALADEFTEFMTLPAYNQID